MDAALDEAVAWFGGTAKDRSIWARIAWRVGADLFHEAAEQARSEIDSHSNPPDSSEHPRIFQNVLNDRFPKPGTCDTSGHERNLVRRAEKFAKCDEVRHDQTEQRVFERSFLSLDWANEEGSGFDYCDGGRQMRALVRKLDEPYWNRVRELRFWNALYKLRHYPELQTTLRAIRRYRVRRKIFSALQIKANVYRERFSQLTKILKIPT